LQAAGSDGPRVDGRQDMGGVAPGASRQCPSRVADSAHLPNANGLQTLPIAAPVAFLSHLLDRALLAGALAAHVPSPRLVAVDVYGCVRFQRQAMVQPPRAPAFLLQTGKRLISFFPGAALHRPC